MGRGVSSGGGQSSLGYLFGSAETNHKSQAAQQMGDTTPAKNSPQPVDYSKPAGVHGNLANNYFRADGQNCGNFITDRPTTKVHAAPGGGSSLGYLFGGGSN